MIQKLIGQLAAITLAVLTRAMQPPLLLLAYRWREAMMARSAGLHAPPGAS